MKAGYFTVSKEILNSQEWTLIESAIKKVFTEVCRKEIGSGTIEIHGESDLFEDLTEASTKAYQCIITTREGNISFDKFIPA